LDSEDLLQQRANIAEAVQCGAEGIAHHRAGSIQRGIGRGQVEQVVVPTAGHVDVVQGEDEGRALVLVEGQTGAEGSHARRAGQQRRPVVGLGPEHSLCPQTRDGLDVTRRGVGPQDVDGGCELRPVGGRPAQLDPRNEHRVPTGPRGHPQTEEEVCRADVELDGVAFGNAGPAHQLAQLAEPQVECGVVVQDRLDPVDECAQATARAGRRSEAVAATGCPAGRGSRPGP